MQYASLAGYAPVMSNFAFIKVVYKNVLSRSTLDADGLAYWAGALGAGKETHASLLNTILASPHTFKSDATFGYVADVLDNRIKVDEIFAITAWLAYNAPDQSIVTGMAIPAAITPTDTLAAIRLIGVPDGLSL